MPPAILVCISYRFKYASAYIGIVDILVAAIVESALNVLRIVRTSSAICVPVSRPLITETSMLPYQLFRLKKNRLCLFLHIIAPHS